MQETLLLSAADLCHLRGAYPAQSPIAGTLAPVLTRTWPSGSHGCGRGLHRPLPPAGAASSFIPRPATSWPSSSPGPAAVPLSSFFTEQKPNSWPDNHGLRLPAPSASHQPACCLPSFLLFPNTHRHMHTHRQVLTLSLFSSCPALLLSLNPLAHLHLLSSRPHP